MYKSIRNQNTNADFQTWRIHSFLEEYTGKIPKNNFAIKSKKIIMGRSYTLIIIKCYGISAKHGRQIKGSIKKLSKPAEYIKACI